MVSLDHLNEKYEEQGGFQIRCDGPSVESTILIEEVIYLLAQGDLRKEIILLHWSQGASDTEISKVLAHRFGGSSAYQRQYVIRFKKKLREQMRSRLA